MDAEVGVVGAGTMGAMALWRLARAGIDALGFEQFTLGHDRSAAGGESRMLRAAEPATAPLLRRAVALWRELEAETGQRLLTQAGGLVIGAPDGDLVRAALDTARQSAHPYEVLDAAAMGRRYPQHRLAPGEVGLLDPEAGFVRPEFAVLAATRRAAELGARIAERTAVLRIEPASDGVTVVTADRSYRVGQLVVAAGPWTADLLPQLAGLIALRRIVLTWYLAADPGQWAPERCPVFVHLVDGLDLAGFPSLDGGSVKVAASASDSPLATAGQLDLRVAPEQIEAVNAGVARWLPGLCPRPVRVAAYMDGYTQDGRPLAGTLPGGGNVRVLAGFSGRGFKYAPAVGEAAVHLVRGEDPGLPAAQPGSGS
jgi:sarcosine oxidase